LQRLGEDKQLQARVDQLERERAQQQDALQALQGAQADAEAALRQQHALEVRLQETESQHAAAGAQLQELLGAQADAEAALRQQEALESRLAESEAQHAAAAAELEQLRARLAELDTESRVGERLTRRLEALQSDRTQFEQKMLEMAARPSEGDDTGQELRLANDGLKARVEDLETERTQHLQRLGEHDALQRRVRKLELERAQHLQRLGELAPLRAQVDELRQEKTALRAELAAAQKQRTDDSQAVTRLQAQLDRAEDTARGYDAMRETLAGSKGELLTLKQEVQRLTEERTELRARAAQHDKDALATQERRAKVEAEAEALRSRLQTLEQERERTHAWVTEVREKNAKLERDSRRVGALHDELTSAMNERDHLRVQLAELERERARYLDWIQELEQAAGLLQPEDAPPSQGEGKAPAAPQPAKAKRPTQAGKPPGGSKQPTAPGKSSQPTAAQKPKRPSAPGQPQPRSNTGRAKPRASTHRVRPGPEKGRPKPRPNVDTGRHRRSEEPTRLDGGQRRQREPKAPTRGGKPTIQRPQKPPPPQPSEVLELLDLAPDAEPGNPYTTPVEELQKQRPFRGLADELRLQADPPQGPTKSDRTPAVRRRVTAEQASRAPRPRPPGTQLRPDQTLRPDLDGDLPTAADYKVADDTSHHA
jgi:hypothetical protein